MRASAQRVVVGLRHGLQPLGKELLDWLGGDLERLNIAATFNLAYNASLLVEQGLGYMIAFDYLFHHESLVTRPLTPELTADVYVAWKRDKAFSPAARLFLEALRARYGQVAGHYEGGAGR